jgi:arginase
VLGVPSSAGAHFGGLEQGPEHFRQVGLHSRLADAGFDVRDLGDLPGVTWARDTTTNQPRSLAKVTAVAHRVAERIATTYDGVSRSLVIGGDCSITAGVVSGLARAKRRIGVVYLDGHVDLNTLESSDYGVLDSMVMTHMLGIYDNEYSRLGPTYPLLNDDQVLFLGYGPDAINQGEVPILSARQVARISRHDVSSNPELVPDAIRSLETRVDTILVHFDVDVINFLDLPVGNFPWYNGLTVDQTAYCLEHALSSPKFAGLVLTEFNPDRDKQLQYATKLSEILVDTLSRGSVRWASESSSHESTLTGP